MFATWGIAQMPLQHWRMLGELCARANWPRHEISAAIGANALEDIIGASGAEGAFEGADPGLAALRRQVLVAAFAIRSKVEHGWFPHL
jgi:hypothetical protein